MIAVIFAGLMQILPVAQADSTIEIYGEVHGTSEAQKIREKLFKGAQLGICKAAFEAIPDRLNCNKAEKEEFLKNLNLDSATLSNVYGIDSEELKLLDVLAMNAISVREGFPPGRDREEALFSALMTSSAKAILPKSPKMKVFKNIVDKIAVATDRYDIISVLPLGEPAFKDFLFQAYATVAEHLTAAKIPYLRVDLATYHNYLEGPQAAEIYVNESIQFRDRHMAKAIKGVCESQLNIPVWVNVGHLHAVGIERQLKAQMPNAKVKVVMPKR